MRIRVLGAGWYGCHIALTLLRDGHRVEVHEKAPAIFAGASGANPARLHLGAHYPRSHATRAMCQHHQAEFLLRYGHLTCGVPINIYAVAEHDSLVDFGTYCQVLRSEIELVTVARPSEYGLAHVEGAILVGERHIVINKARVLFASALANRVRFGVDKQERDDGWDMTVDCTFCAHDATAIDRFEPCVTALLEGPADRAVTIMDGPFPSIYPWDPERKLSSLTSARYTPLTKNCRTYEQARQILDEIEPEFVAEQGRLMLEQIGHYWPHALDRYRIVGHLLSVRAMPRSGSDARLVDVVWANPRRLRVRAGKIDAIFHAERIVREAINTMRGQDRVLELMS